MQQDGLHAMIDTAEHAVALHSYAGSTAPPSRVVANAFFSALMLASLDDWFDCYLGPRREAVEPPPGAPLLTAGAAGLASRIENEYA